MKKIRVPGLSGRGIPEGYILGRLRGAKHGDVQLLDLGHLRQFGVAGGASTKKDQSVSGFTFNETGLMLANELLGTGSWPHDVTFTNDFTDQTLVQSDFSPTVSGVMRILATILGVPTQVGSITFTAGTPPITAAVSWVSSPYVHLAGNPMSLYAPLVANATLANCHGVVAGYRS